MNDVSDIYNSLSYKEKKQIVVKICSRLPFIQIEVKQNTDVWKKLRLGKYNCRIGSSEIGTAAGLSMYCSPYTFFERRVNNIRVEPNEAMLKGTQLEDKAATYYEQVMDNGKLKEAGYLIPNVRETNPNPYFKDLDSYFFGASLDRFATTEGNCHVEIKCPYNKRSFLKNYAEGVSYTHLAQMHLQMAMCNVKKIHYCAVYFIKNKDDEYRVAAAKITEVNFDLFFWNTIVKHARCIAEWLYKVSKNKCSKDHACEEVYKYFKDKFVLNELLNHAFIPSTKILHNYRCKKFNDLDLLAS